MAKRPVALPVKWTPIPTGKKGKTTDTRSTTKNGKY